MSYSLFQKKVDIAAILSSQVLAQLSTVKNAGGLICRVRNESGSFPVAMAAMPNEIMMICIYKGCKELTEKNRNPFISTGAIMHIVAIIYLHFCLSWFGE
jgi:hypothetical protein